MLSIAPRIEPVGSDGSFSLPLSHEQARLWFLAQADPTDVSYHMAYRITLSGKLETTALERALEHVVSRHETLRTRYLDVDGEPRQIVRPHRVQRIDRADLGSVPFDARAAEMSRLDADLVRHPFDLASGDLMRLLLMRLSETEHCLTVVMHHIIGDGWSHAVLVRDLCAYYTAEMSGRAEDRPRPLTLQYADYALWQRRVTSTPQCAAQVRYWVDQLRGADPLRLPRDFQPASGAGAPGGTVRFRLPDSLREPLRRAVEQGRLLSAVLLAAYEATLARFADQDTFSLGIAIANRLRDETADLIGFFVNTLALPSDTNSGLRSDELVGRVQRRLIDAQARQGAPFELVVASLGASGSWGQTPVIRALFVLQNAPPPRFDLPGLSVSVERIHTGTSKFELTLFATEHGRSIEFELEYHARLFASQTIESLRDAFLDVLTTVVSGPDAPVHELPVTRRSRPSILTGLRRPELAARTVIARFLDRVSLAPESVAVESGRVQLTYGELLDAAKAYAGCLRDREIGRGDVVAVLLPTCPSS